MRVSWILPLEKFDPKLVLFIDAIALFHIVAFGCMVMLFVGDIGKSKEKCEEERQQTKQDRE